MELLEVIGGGGTDRQLLRFKPTKTVRNTGAKIVRVRKYISSLFKT